MNDITADAILDRLWMPYQELENMVDSLLDSGLITQVDSDEYQLSKKGMKLIKEEFDEYFSE